MKSRFFLSLLILVLIKSVSAQSLNPTVIATCGGYSTNGSNSLSWTAGETFTATFSVPGTMLTQGFQQPAITLVLVNLKAFIQGYYQGGGMMTQVLYNEGIDTDPSSTNVDTLTVELHDPNNPETIVQTFKGVIQTDGNMICKFPSAVNGHAYYIALKHRSAVQTWSADPVLFSQNTLYDFTTAAAKAYGGNLVDLYGENIWSVYQGDMNQDGSIDIFDFPPLDDDITQFNFGYLNTDLDGNGGTDIFDFPVLDGNISGFIYAIYPF